MANLTNKNLVNSCWISSPERKRTAFTVSIVNQRVTSGKGVEIQASRSREFPKR
jgi:hypothetical protein